jgi:fructose-specific phosphotransferase system IIA component
MNILDILSPKTVKAPLDATDKRSAIDELADLLAEAGLVSDAARLKAVVWEREQQRSTGIGEGLAIPHGKCDCAPNLAMAIGRPATPIDFSSVDKKPVNLVVLLASPPDKTAEHIQALGKISRLMTNPEFREATYAAESSEALYELFEDAEH